MLVKRPRFAVALAVALAFSCVGGPLPAERRYHQQRAQERLRELEQPGIVIGEFALAPDPVIDGDTIRVAGLRSSLRLLALDAEETFKTEKDRRAFEKGWEQYQKAMRGDSPRPVKYPTPLGEEAKKFAEQFFAGVTTVRLERDHPKEIRDYYDRYLAYVFVLKDGVWKNYNLECVRAGMSPYFTKYGRSRRFHEEFVKAQEEARAARRGIWDPSKMHYPDYDERLAWWNARADFIAAFEKEAEGRDDWIVLTRWDAVQKLEQHIGQEVTVLGAVGDVRYADRGPARVLLSRRRSQDFALIFWDKDVFASSGVERLEGEYIRARGFVSLYKNTRRKKYELQMVIDVPSQIQAAR